MTKLVCLVLALSTGCSFVFTSGPPEQPRAYPDCTSSYTWPVVDAVFSAIFLTTMMSAIAEDDEMSGDDDEATRGQKITSAALFAVATGAGAYVGYRRVNRCRAARETFQRANPYPYGYPYPQPYPPAYPQPYPPAPQVQPQIQPPPPSPGLGTEGDVCAADAECATGLTCQQNVCIRPPAPR